MSKGDTSLKVYRYYLSQHHVLCLGPIDSVKKIFFDKKEVFSGTHTGGALTIDKEELFGGLDREGGVSGILNFMLGTATQVANTFMTAKFGVSPAYRRLVSCVHEDFYVGLNYYLKPPTYLLKRVTATSTGTTVWQPAYAEPISGQMNAVHIIRDMLTDNIYGLGINTSLIGSSFDTAAQTTYNEGYGFSFLFRNTESLDTYIKDVLDHIDAVLYVDRITNKFEVKLIRNDYTIGSLFNLTTSNVKEISSFKRTLLGELFSKVTIKFWNEATLEDAVESSEDITLASKQNGTIEKVLTRSGVTSHSLAKKISINELAKLSTQVFSGTLVCDRTAENLNIGSAFVLKAAANKYLDYDIVCRVSTIDLGTITNNYITITFVQDIFSAQENPIFTTPSSDWVPVISSAIAVTDRLIQEVTYYQFARIKGDVEARGVDTTVSYVGLAGKAPSGDSISAQIWINSLEKGILHFCPFAQIATAFDKTATSITLKNMYNFSQVILGQTLQIGNEIVSITAIAGTTATIVRGCVDTVPESHAVDEKCFAYQQLFGYSSTQYLLAEAPSIRLLTTTPLNTLAFASAPADILTITGRMHKPYPPGNLLINGTSWPSNVTPSADAFTITWATRNRFQQTVSLIGFYTGNITTEVGVTYSGNLKRTDNSTILSSFSGNATTTQSIATTGYTGQVTLSVWSVNANGSSFQTITHTFFLGSGWNNLASTWNLWTSWS